MANKTLDELEQVTTIATGDQMLLDDISEPDGSVSKYVTIQQLDNRYLAFDPTVTPIGEMYQINNLTTTDILVATEFVKIENFLAGINQLVTFAANTLTIGKTGKYLCNVAIAGFKVSGVNTRLYEFGVFVNGIESTKIKAVRDFTNQVSGAVNLTGILDLTIEDEVDLRVACLNDNIDFTVVACDLNLTGQ